MDLSSLFLISLINVTAEEFSISLLREVRSKSALWSLIHADTDRTNILFSNNKKTVRIEII